MAYETRGYSLHTFTPNLLDAVQRKHALRSHSEALRFLLATAEPIYLGTRVLQMPASPQTQLERRRSLLSNDDIRAMPLATREAFARWQASGELPSESAIDEALASGFPRERLEAALGVPL